MHALEFKFKPSRYYFATLAIVMVVSIGIVCYLDFVLWVRLSLLLSVLCYGSWLFWRFGCLRSARAVVGIRRFKDGKWLLQMPNATYVADLRGDSTVTRWVAVLRFQPLDHFWTRSCIVFPDSLEVGHYRQLVMQCRVR